VHFPGFTDLLGANEAVGLSLGTGAVRAVRLARSAAGFEVTAKASVEFASGRPPHPADVEAALEEVAGATLGGHARLVTNVPARQARLFFIDQPFDRPEKVRQVLPFAVETQTMAHVEGLHFDYLPLVEPAGQGKPAAAFAADPADISAVMDGMHAVGLDPPVLLPDNVGLLAAGQLLLPDDETEYRLVLDLGATQTGIFLFQGKRALLARTLPYGGQDLTQALAEGLDQDPAEAEALKRSTDLENESPPAVERPLLIQALEPLLVEIERTLAASLPENAAAPVVLLAGGGARTRGLPAYLSRRLGLNAAPFPMTGMGPENGISPEFAPAFGLALLGLWPKHRPNLRQGMLAPAQALLRYKGQLALAAAGLFLVILFSLTSLVMDYRYHDRRYRMVKSEIQQVFKETLPGETAMVSPLAQLRHELEKSQAGGAGVAGGGRRVLDVLLAVSQVTGTRRGLRLLDLSITPSVVELKGEGGKFEDVDRLKEDLAQLPLFSEVTVGGARIDQATRKLTFTVSLKRAAP